MSDREVLVTGGTGVLGRRVVGHLGDLGVEARVMSRSGRTGTVKGDLLTGEGLAGAVHGVDTVIHCASSPLRKTRRTDVGGTQRLLDEVARAGISHVVYVSIVGIDRVPSYPYYRAKLGAERLVEGSAVPHTILRATQFHDLMLGMVRAINRLPLVAPVPKGSLFQPVDVGEVAERLVELALSGPAGRAPDFGGPDIRTLPELMDVYLRVLGQRKRIVEVPLPGRLARALRDGAQVTPGTARGRVSWEEFLGERTGDRGVQKRDGGAT